MDAVKTEIVKIIVDFLGVITAALVAILVYSLGERSLHNKERKRINDLQVYLSFTLNQLTIPIDKQVESLSKFINDLNAAFDQDLIPEWTTSLNSKNINWVSYEDRYKIIVKRRRSPDAFRDMNDQLIYIDSIEDSLFRYTDYLTKHRTEFVKDWNKNIRAIANLRDELVTAYQKDFEFTQQDPHPFLAGFSKIYDEWTVLDNFTEREIAEKKFLIPLQKFCRDMHGEEIALKLLGYINNCMLANANIKNLKLMITTECQVLVSRLLKSRVIFVRVSKLLL